MSDGDCFEVALKLAMEDPGLTVVHGLPLGTGPENDGKRFWHAWCEQTEVLEFPNHPETRLTFVIDQSNGRDFCVPRALYYKIGHIEQTWRYTLDEAAAQALRHEHYGPWNDGWEEMTDV